MGSAAWPPSTPTALGGHADVGVAVPEQLGVGEAEVGVAVHAGGHVEPLDEHRAVEGVGIRRPAHDDAGPVRRRAGGVTAQRPSSPSSPVRLVGGRVALEEVLLLDVAVARRPARPAWR